MLYLRYWFGEKMMNALLDMMESVTLAGHSDRLFSRQLEMVNYILERSEDLLRRGRKLFMRFIRTNQVFEKESEK